MTYSEYLTVLLGKFGLNASDIGFILIEADLSPNKTVESAEDKLLLKKAVHYNIPGMIAGLSNVSEGGYSVTWNIEGIKMWYSVLSKELGLEDMLSTKPKIRDRSNRW